MAEIRGKNEFGVGGFGSDMSMDLVGPMIPEDFSTNCSIRSMIQTDPMAKFDSRYWGYLGNVWDWISDPIGSLMELVASDLYSKEIVDPSGPLAYLHQAINTLFLDIISIQSYENVCWMYISMKKCCYSPKKT